MSFSERSIFTEPEESGPANQYWQCRLVLMRADRFVCATSSRLTQTQQVMWEGFFFYTEIQTGTF